MVQGSQKGGVYVAEDQGHHMVKPPYHTNLPTQWTLTLWQILPG